MPARTTEPDPLLTEAHQRAQRIFARLMGGESMRAIAASENLSVRRVQQIVREQLDRRNAKIPPTISRFCRSRGSSGRST